MPLSTKWKSKKESHVALREAGNELKLRKGQDLVWTTLWGSHET